MKCLIIQIFIITILLMGCGNQQSMIRSIKADDKNVESGMVYSLPKQLVKVTYIRKAIDSTKAAKKVKDLKKQIGDKETEKKSKSAQIKELEALISNVNTAAAGSTPVLDKYRKGKLMVKTEKLVLTGQIGVLKGKLLKAEQDYAASLQSDKAFSEQLSIAAETTIADTTESYVANLNHKKSHSDTFELKIKNGLLDGAIGRTEDKTGEIVTSLAGGVSGLIGFPGLLSVKTVGLPIPVLPVTCNKKDAISVTQVIDPDDAYDFIILNRQLHAGCFSLCVTKPNTASISLPTAGGSVNGLLYRQPGTYSFYVRDSNTLNYMIKNGTCTSTDKLNAIQTMKLTLAQGGQVGNVELPKGRFSKNEYDIEFSNGMLTKNKIIQPSEILGAVKILPNALREIISIPTELIQLKVNYSTGEKDLIELEKAIIQAEVEIEKRQQELDALLEENGLPTVILPETDD